MRGIDPETGEYLSPSRSANRREALDVLEMCKQLVAMSKTQLAKLPVPEHLIPVIDDTQKIKSHIAHKRQLAFLAKQFRREDDDVIDTLRDAMSEDGEAARIETAQLHRAEQWRERFLDEGDSALGDFAAEFPDCDRQSLRTLTRNALEERRKNKPPRAFRELYREIRNVMSASSGEDASSESDDDDAEHDEY